MAALMSPVEDSIVTSSFETFRRSAEHMRDNAFDMSVTDIGLKLKIVTKN